MTSIMPAQSLIDFFAGADVPPARLRATQNVNVKHGLEVKLGLAGFEPTTCRRGDRSANLGSRDRLGFVSYIGLAGFEPTTS
jgi:hypothetical protein